jgi:hypothetical protein
MCESRLHRFICRVSCNVVLYVVSSPPLFLFVMSDVMWIVTNHGENQAGLLFRVDSARLFVMSDVIFNVLVRDCRQG